MQSLDLLAQDAGSKKAKKLIQSLSDSTLRGLPLSESFATFPKVFSPFHIQLVMVGETTGTLPETLLYVADILARQLTLRRSVVGALAYPFIIALGTLGISTFLTFYAFPKIVPVLKGFHTKLPFATRVMIGLSSALQAYWLYGLCGIVLMAISCASLYRNKKVRMYAHACLLRSPLCGDLVRSYYVTTITRMLNVLISSGVRLDVALEFIGDGIGNLPYRNSLELIRTGIWNGTTLSNQMRAFPRLYPLVAVQLIAAGEMTGSLSESSRTVAVIYEERLEEGTKMLGMLLEPLLMVGMGFVVGFVALAIITPMYGITKALSLH